MDLDRGTHVLITGANGGIGRAIALAFKEAGTSLVLSGRRADALKPVADETGAQVLVADLADRDAVSRLAAEAGEVDVLIANAALPASGSIFDFKVEEIDRALDVNLRAPIAMARVFGERMKARKRGHIIFISSVAGMIATAATSLYSATKFGLRGFALGLRADLAPHGVGVTVIYPGFIRDAGMFADANVKLPRMVGSRTPGQVAEAVIDAIQHDPAELTVAAADQRLGAWLAKFWPGVGAAFERMGPAQKFAKQVAEGQRHKR
jgi:short-subunit dehydrogenase